VDLEPIAFDHELKCTPDRAFDAYANRIAEWWHPSYTADAATLERVTIAPGLGGRVYEKHTNGKPLCQIPT